jgi:alanine dehydrogenase
MLIGIPRETKPLERRVGATPQTVAALVADGHTVQVEAGAGAGAGYVDAAYLAAGALVVSTQEVWQADLIAKVKEVQPADLPHIKPGQVLMGFMHIAEDEARCQALLSRDVTAIGYEYITDVAGRAPIVAPMSVIAGKLAVLQGAGCLASAGGRGTLLAAVPGAAPAHVLLLGAGDACAAAAQSALALGASVSVAARDVERATAKLAAVGATVARGARVIDIAAVKAVLPSTDLLIAAVWQPGARNPVLLTRDDVASMPRGSVIVDITVDGGSPIETMRPTTLATPTFVAEGLIHSAVPNMPAGVPKTASDTLASAALPYLLAVARLGAKAAAKADATLARGVLLAHGQVTNAYVAEQRGRLLNDFASPTATH